jgi:hypothetical protein
MVQSNESGLPMMSRIRLPLVPQVEILNVMTTDVSVLEMKTAVYDRGEALSDETHRWPYIYTGMCL